jgi:hypothetical protein
MADRKNDNGWNYVEELARQMFLDPKTAAELVAKASAPGCLPGIKASVERAAALNAPKLALLATAERCKELGSFQRGGRGPLFYLDLPYTIEPLFERYGPLAPSSQDGAQVYLPVHRNYKPLGTDYAGPVRGYDVADLAWHSGVTPARSRALGRRSNDCCYFYTSVDYDNYRTEKEFLAAYRDRLRRVLAEAVPGMGGLSLETEW